MASQKNCANVTGVALHATPKNQKQKNTNINKINLHGLIDKKYARGLQPRNARLATKSEQSNFSRTVLFAVDFFSYA